MEVLCDDLDCAWCKPLGEERFIEHYKNYNPLAGMGYRGVCTREEIGIKARKIETHNTIYHIPECRSFSNKGISGHIDFSRFPQGGRILGSQEH